MGVWGVRGTCWVEAVVEEAVEMTWFRIKIYHS